MTSKSLNLAYLKRSLSTVDVTDIVDYVKQTSRLRLAFSFYLNQDLNVRVDSVSKLGQQFAKALETAWETKTTGMLISVIKKLNFHLFIGKNVDISSSNYINIFLRL